MSRMVGRVLPTRPRSITLDVLLLWALVLLPPAGLMLANASSMTSGIVGACLLVVAADLLFTRELFAKITWSIRTFRIIGMIVAAIVPHAVLMSIVWHQIDWVRLFGSLLVVIIVLIAAACMGNRLARYSSREMSRILAWTTGMLLVLLVESMFGPQIFAPLNHPRPIFVFTEPSHFALAFIPFAGFFIVQLRGVHRWVVVVGAMTIGLAIQSTTLVAGLLLLMLACLRWRQLVVFLVMCAALIVAVGFDLKFIAERIVYSEDINNLSNLVLLQGWERAWLALLDTYGLGLGFQQFGVWGPMGELQDLIKAAAGENLNLTDGGTSASKLVAEFGIFGIVLLLLWARAWWTAASFLRSALKGPVKPALLVFMHVCVVAIGVELWVRGIGYLSLGFFFLCLFITSSKARMNSGLSRFKPKKPVIPSINFDSRSSFE